MRILNVLMLVALVVACNNNKVDVVSVELQKNVSEPTIAPLSAISAPQQQKVTLAPVSKNGSSHTHRLRREIGHTLSQKEHHIKVLRDPFRGYFAVMASPEQENINSLFYFDVDSLKLVGVVIGIQKIALLEDPTGRGHTVKEGAIIGRGRDIVRQIRDNEIVIESKQGQHIQILKLGN